MAAIDWALLLVLSGLWSGSFFFYKILVGALPPLTVVFGRVALAAAVLAVVVTMRRSPMPTSARGWSAFALLGLLNNAVPYALIVYGETRLSSGLAAILNATTPMFTIIVARLASAEERITPGRLAGLLIGFLGVVVLVGPDAAATLGNGDLAAALACLLASLSYGVAAVYARRFKAMPPLSVAAGQLVGSSFIMLPLCLLIDRPWTLPMPAAGAWSALIGLAIPSTALAYLIYFRILASAGATNASLVTLLVPVGAVLLGVWALGETVSVDTLLGMALIGISLLVIDGRLVTRLRRSAPVAR